MNVVAHIRELVVEGDASFSLQQFQERLGAELARLGLAVPTELVLGELVVHAGPSLDAAVAATVRTLGERLRGQDR